MTTVCEVQLSHFGTLLCLAIVNGWNETMMQNTRAGLLTRVVTVEEVLANHSSELARDAIGYRNHVYRVLNLCLAITGNSRVDFEKIAVASVFHDLGIWTDHTFDYIAPSVELAREYLTTSGTAGWIPEIEAMIVNHHKIRQSNGDTSWLVEAFRRADWIDVSNGLRRFGLPPRFIGSVKSTWPDAGFHRRLVELTIQRWWNHPLSPLPMVKW